MDNQNVPCLSSCTGPAYLPNEARTSSSGEPVNSSDIKPSGGMAGADIKPKCMERAKKWSDEVENLYRFQQAGYRDEIEYKQVKHVDMVDRWPETGFVKKLQRRDNTFYYYNRQRECDDKEVHKVKVYAY
ncbi:PREDICTED: meiosis expressed gene 1 protein homolog [Crocodylus porosus]|nr:PREDICTED: meiosis expressed gene 1 protein homolog [Crocodylus porosus]XP_019399204.1 PREDICTED: meiosis expressed gene 1 protein homolog [Crocodylus porosus]XP_019399206.1 PREDICTED: meiosis expressed gene 1 protein homolog [Crocodylus porosus]XP_019399207.1 PREDICTED: meiosis expressed gene 1 protein homolog [Crocodylus porosus]